MSLKYLLPLLVLLACNTRNNAKLLLSEDGSGPLIDSTAMDVSQRFPVPEGYVDVQTDSLSFGWYLAHLPLHPVSYPVHYFDGNIKNSNGIYCSVVDQDIDAVDLQQCADAVMRLRAEYLYGQKRYANIHFNFLSDGKPRYYENYVNGDHSYKTFRKYLRYIFSYANTASLHDELQAVNDIHDIRAGDVFVRKQQPFGHAVIVLRVVQNSDGEKLFLLAQSYMPAQETQVLLNPASPDRTSPWFEAKNGLIETPEWPFTSSDLRRFKE